MAMNEATTMQLDKTDNSQNISEDADGPHVGVKTDRFVIGDLRSGELRSGCRHFDDLVWIELCRQTEVNELNISTLLFDAHHVLRLCETLTTYRRCKVDQLSLLSLWGR